MKKCISHRREKNRGFTIVELLVIIAIVALAVGLVIPAIQQVREASRKTQCMMNLKTVGAAFIEHHDIHGNYPTGGWGERWIGDPERGFDKKQPGGWAFNILPFLNHDSLYNLGKELDYDGKKNGFTERITTPLPLYYCPSRRAALNYPSWRFFQKLPPNQVRNVDFVAKTDYAANAGDAKEYIKKYPLSYKEGDGDYPWESTITLYGICFQRSEVHLSDLLDGAANTYLVGEKYLPILAYDTSISLGDHVSVYSGQIRDSLRSANPEYLPMYDQPQTDYPNRFGSAHPDSWNVIMCDGSARKMSYNIAPLIHSSLGDRRDQRKDQNQLDLTNP